MISWFEKHNKVSWIITILIAIAIFYISSLTSESIGRSVASWQTVVYHFLAFFFLAAFLLISLVQGRKQEFIFLAIILALFYGVTDEIHQLFVPGRVCSFSDFLIDSSGILFASLSYSLLRLRRFNR